MKQTNSPFRYILPVALAAAMTFSGHLFTLGTINAVWAARQILIRWDDVVILIIVLSLIPKFFLSSRLTFTKPPLYPLLPLWIIFELVSSLINAIAGYLLPLRVLFYTLKASEYAFIFYYIFTFIKTPRDLKILMRAWMVFIWIHLGYIFYQFLYSTEQGSIRLIGENGNFNIGVQFLVMAMYAFSYFLFYTLRQPISPAKKIMLGVFYVVPLIGIFTAGIKAGAVAGVICVLLLLIAYLLKVASPLALKRVGIFALTIGVMLIALTFASKKLPYDFIYYRTLNFPSYGRSLDFRANIWEQHIQRMGENPLFIIIGRGGADPYAEASHNQYVRNLTAGGIMGSLIFLLLIFAILRASWRSYRNLKDPLAVAFSAGLFVATIGMLMTGGSGESFLIVRPAEHFWYFAGMAFAAMYFENHKNTNRLTS